MKIKHKKNISKRKPELTEREMELFRELNATHMTRDLNGDVHVEYWKGQPYYMFGTYYTARNNSESIRIVSLDELGGTTSLQPGDCVHLKYDGTYELLSIKEVRAK